MNKVKYSKYINNMKKIIKFIIYVFGPLILGFIISMLTNSESYTILNKPFLSPPKIVFPIAWSILYLLMGISFYIVNKDEIRSIKNFLIQLILNLIWPILFFNLKLYVLSIIVIILMLYFVSNMIVDFYNIKKIAGYLQLPYLVWLIFALYLNIGVAILN